MTIRAPKGTDDILPPESDRWRVLLRAFDDIAERYGYGLALTPVFEPTDLFARGVGEATEVVQKQMYTFRDKKGRSLTLRPELTASIVRAYIQAGRSGVLKTAYAGPMFRYEQPQAGRRRQFLQLDIEYIGEAAAEADVEVIEVGYRLLRDAGMDDVDVLLNSIGDPVCRPEYRERLLDYFEAKRDDLCADCRARLTDNPLRVLDCKVDRPKLIDAPVALDYLCDECGAHFATVRTSLQGLGIPYDLDKTLVRGLDYYTRTVFEYVPSKYEAAQSSVGGGGRYDGLAQLLGGPPTPGVGLAMGLDRVLLALGDRLDATVGLDAYVVIADSERRSDAFELASRLRRDGLRVDVDLAGRSVKAQFRAADRMNARVALVVGAEWADGKLAARDLDTGDQELVAIEEITEWIRRR